MELTCHCGALNMRMADPNVLAGIAVRKLDGAVTERYVE